MGFVDDNTDLTFPKVDRRPIPPNESSTKFIAAADWNELCQGAADTRDWIRAATWYGLTAQAADPAPVGVTNYIWLKDDGTLWSTVDGTASQVGGAGGGITNGAGANVLMKSDGTNAVASNLSDNGTTIVAAIPINQTVSVGANVAYLDQVIMKGSVGVNHMTEAVAIVGFVTEMVFGATSNAIGGQFKANATSTGGAVVTNTAVQGTASSGDINYSWFSNAGTMRQEQSAQFATQSGYGVLIGSGTLTADTFTIGMNTSWGSSYSVSLGQKVAAFYMPGTSAANTNIRIGRSSTSPFQLAVQNTYTGSVESGIAIHIDTTAISTARGGVRFHRGAGGSTHIGGVEVAGANNSLVTGSVANDVLLYATNGGHVMLGTTVGSSSQGRVSIDSAGQVTINAPDSGTALTVSGAVKVTGNVGFYGTTPAAKPSVTGSRGGNAALASLLAGLASLGLLTDSTTA